MSQERLFTPGPTPIPPSVLEVLAKPIIHHRTAEFQTVLARVTAGLMRVFKTKQPVLSLAASGSGGLEAALVNLASPGETVAVLHAGKFGERWVKIARAYGLKVVELANRWGEHFEPEQVAEFLAGEAKDATMLLMTHSETSTGVLNDLEAIAKVARTHNKLVVADVVTSLGVHPIEFDAWGLDAVISGSQKGMMLPPGMAMVAFSDRAWEKNKSATLPRFYLDLRSARDNINKNSTPFTPPVPVVLAMEESIRLMEEEGLDNVYARHARHANACRAAVKAFGLEMFAQRPSNGLTAVRTPEGKDSTELVKNLREQHGFRIAGGQAPMKGKLFRLGHMGYYNDQDIRDLIQAVGTVMADLGWSSISADEAVNAVLTGASS